MVLPGIQGIARGTMQWQVTDFVLCVRNDKTRVRRFEVFLAAGADDLTTFLHLFHAHGLQYAQ